MGSFNYSVLTNSAKIAQTISDCSSEIINHLILKDIPIRTHDSLTIIMTIMSNYCFTVIKLDYADKSRDYKQELIGMIKKHTSDLATEIINPSIGNIAEDLYPSFMEPDCAADENFKEWLIEWNKKFSNITEVNFEIEENTSQILIDYLNNKFDLDSIQSEKFKDFIFGILKNSCLQK